MLKKLAVKKEPILDAPRYVVVVIKKKNIKKHVTKSTYHYVYSLKQADVVANAAPKGSEVHVFRATHNFIKAVQPVK